MSAAPLAAALATALSAGVLLLDLPTLSTTALVGLVWVALAPLMALVSDRPWRCALALVALAAPQLALSVAADHGAGASLERLFPTALAAVGWTAALGAATTAFCATGRSERWFVVWSAIAGAGPLFALALGAGGGDSLWLASMLTRVSPLSALFGMAPLSASSVPSPAPWIAYAFPTAAMSIAARWTKGAPPSPAGTAHDRDDAPRAEASRGG